MKKPHRESAKYWTTPLLAGGELLTARFQQQRFCRHWHETYVIAVILGGAQGYWYRGAQCIAPSGTLVVINPGEVHTGEAGTPVGWAYRAFYPPANWIEGLGRTLTGRPATATWFPAEPIADPELGRQLAAAHMQLERHIDVLEAETALHSACTSLLVRHAKNRPQPAAIATDTVRVARMQQRLADDLTEPISLTTLAASVGLSPFHAARLFATIVGMPPHAWRNQVRIGRAVGLLRRGASVTEAATDVGFYDQSHFTRHFRRAYGVPPGQLAKAVRS
jgi:AraC-like DNA-binding protein